MAHLPKATGELRASLNEALIGGACLVKLKTSDSAHSLNLYQPWTARIVESACAKTFLNKSFFISFGSDGVLQIAQG